MSAPSRITLPLTASIVPGWDAIGQRFGQGSPAAG